MNKKEILEQLNIKALDASFEARDYNDSIHVILDNLKNYIIQYNNTDFTITQLTEIKKYTNTIENLLRLKEHHEAIHLSLDHFLNNLQE